MRRVRSPASQRAKQCHRMMPSVPAATRRTDQFWENWAFGVSVVTASRIETSAADRAKSHFQVLGDLGLWGLGCDCFAF
jgi:hypothetical protein